VPHGSRLCIEFRQQQCLSHRHLKQHSGGYRAGRQRPLRRGDDVGRHACLYIELRQQQCLSYRHLKQHRRGYGFSRDYPFGRGGDARRHASVCDES